MNRIKSPPCPASTATNIGRVVERNLTSFITATAGEIRRSDTIGENVYPLVALGFDLLKARGLVRDSIRRAELQRWGAMR